jgi:hypothetical protein
MRGGYVAGVPLTAGGRVATSVAFPVAAAWGAGVLQLTRPSRTSS